MKKCSCYYISLTLHSALYFFAFSFGNSVFSLIILHVSDVSDSHTCAALLMAENKAKIDITTQTCVHYEPFICSLCKSKFSFPFHSSVFQK